MRIYGEIIREKEGQEGVEKVEKKLEELGYPIKFSKVKSMDWEDEALSTLVLLTMKEVLGWTDEDIFYTGWFAPRNSFIIKVLVRYFVSVEKAFDNAAKYWRKHFNFGELEPVSLDKENRRAVIRVKGYDFHPIICIYWMGYFTSVVELSLPKSKVDIKEVKCVYKGDEYHEFEITWDLL